MPGTVFSILHAFSYLILPKSYKSHNDAFWVWFRVRLVRCPNPTIHPSSSPEFLAKEHIHQRISSQMGKKVLILLMSGKAHKGEHNLGLRLRRSSPRIHSSSPQLA